MSRPCCVSACLETAHRYEELSYALEFRGFDHNDGPDDGFYRETKAMFAVLFSILNRDPDRFGPAETSGLEINLPKPSKQASPP